MLVGAEDGNLLSLLADLRWLGTGLQKVEGFAILLYIITKEDQLENQECHLRDKYGMEANYSAQYSEILMDWCFIASPSADIPVSYTHLTLPTTPYV